MPSKKVTKPMTDAELEAWESSRDLDADLIESVRPTADGKTPGSSHAQFAVVLCVCVRTLLPVTSGFPLLLP